MALLPRHRVGRLWRARLAVLGALLFVLLGVNLLRRGALHSAIACLLVAACLLGVAALAGLAAPSARRGQDAPPPRAGTAAANDLVELMRSTDAVAIEILRGKLAANGVVAEIEGEHTSRMLGYLPVVPQRLMVPRSDLALCSQILAGEDKLN
jgi:hypothetical protein